MVEQQNKVIDNELIDEELLNEIKKNGLLKPEIREQSPENIPDEVPDELSADAKYLGISVSDYSV